MKTPKSVYYRHRTSETLPLKAAIDAFLKDARMEQKFGHEHIKLAWAEIMGAPIAKRTTKLFVKNNKLYIELNSAPLKQELMMSREKVLERVHEFAGGKSIQQVIFL